MKAKHFLVAATVLALASAAGATMARYRNYVTIYYSNASRTVEVGREGIDCSNARYAWGAKTAYSRTTSINCDFPVGEN